MKTPFALKGNTGLIAKAVDSHMQRRDVQLFLAQLFCLGTEKDVLINLRHIMDFGDEEFEILIMNTNTVVHNMIELAKIAGRYV